MRQQGRDERDYHCCEWGGGVGVPSWAKKARKAVINVVMEAPHICSQDKRLALNPSEYIVVV